MGGRGAGSRIHSAKIRANNAKIKSLRLTNERLQREMTYRRASWDTSPDRSGTKSILKRQIKANKAAITRLEKQTSAMKANNYKVDKNAPSF